MSEPVHRKAAWPWICLAAVLSLSPARAADRLSDPTRPPEAARAVAPPTAEAEKGDPALVLSAIFHADDRRIAVIDGIRVREADRIGSARVLAIEADRVRLQRGDEIVELELVSPAFKNARRAAERAPSTDPRGDSK